MFTRQHARSKYRIQNPCSISFVILPLCLVLLLLVYFLHRPAATKTECSSPLKDLKFIPVNDPDIRYSGRWTAAADRSRYDGAFAGTSLDFTVSNSMSVFLCLHNALDQPRNLQRIAPDRPTDHNSRFVFTDRGRDRPAEPVRLLVTTDEIDHLVLPISHGTFAIVKSANPSLHNTSNIRIELLEKGYGASILQFKGLWLSQSGSLVSHTAMHKASDITNSSVSHTARKLNESNILDGTIEIITDDSAASTKWSAVDRRNGLPADVSAFICWDHIIGSLFHTNHISVRATHEAGISTFEAATAFFRSGPRETDLFRRPWQFDKCAPKAMVLELGSSNLLPFKGGIMQENQHARSTSFVESYVKFIKSTRRVSFQTHPVHPSSGLLDIDGYTYNSAPPTTPIFVLRPFMGAMEHETQRVVRMIRAEGDLSVFWIDTTGWLDMRSPGAIGGSEDMYWLGHNEQELGQESMARPRWQLTAQGHRKVAIYLHMHLCRYVADKPEDCPFRPYGMYGGKIHVPQEAQLEKLIEDSKQKKLKSMFWPN